MGAVIRRKMRRRRSGRRISSTAFLAVRFGWVVAVAELSSTVQAPALDSREHALQHERLFSRGRSAGI
jgi:hypothetical protein